MNSPGTGAGRVLARIAATVALLSGRLPERS
jgi:hypothetical protein